MKHTPGPWMVGGKDGFSQATIIITNRANGQAPLTKALFESFIADTRTGHHSEEECKANACLISAAPDYDSSARIAEAVMNNGFISPENESDDFVRGWEAACLEFKNSQARKGLKTAIAKAEGRTP